jgi:hypothetical protein
MMEYCDCIFFCRAFLEQLILSQVSHCVTEIVLPTKAIIDGQTHDFVWSRPMSCEMNQKPTKLM